MTTAPQSLENVFARSWELLRNNWIIIVPGIVIGIVLGVVNALIAPSFTVVQGEDPSVTIARASHAAGSAFLRSCIGLVAFIATQAYTTGMAGAAWLRGTATLDDGTAAFRHDAGRIFLVAIGLIVLALVAAILAIPTIGIALIAYYLFCLYSFPAAIVGNAPGFSGISESFRITMARFVPTLIVGIFIFVISLVGGIIAGLLGMIPFLGTIVGAVIGQIAVGYATLVVVGEYLNLRGAASPQFSQAAAAAGYPAPPPPPTV